MITDDSAVSHPLGSLGSLLMSIDNLHDNYLAVCTYVPALGVPETQKAVEKMYSIST